MRIRSLIVVLILSALLGPRASVVRADVVHLSDGTKVEGDVKRSTDGWIVTGADGKVTNVPAGKVRSIELKGAGASGGAKPSADAMEQRLFSIRRSVENLSNINDVIERYQHFVEQNKGTDLGKAAEQEMAVWVDRRNRGLVKVGQQWVTPEEKAQLLEQTFAVVSEARQLLKDARLKEADAVLAKALQLDPANPSIQYLRGVLKYRQNEVPAARKAFEAVIEQITNHAPSLNNLGVILARQNSEAASIAMYDRAMQASPKDRQVLDNLAEAFNALSPSERKAVVVQRAFKRFAEQDEQLQAEMAKQGQFRWGSTWVNQQQLDALKGAEEKIKGRLDQLATEFDAAQARINTIDQDLEANTRTMRQLDARRYAQNSGGTTVQGTLPPRYYDLQADSAKLAVEREQQVLKMKQLRAAARDVEKLFPTPRFTGTQKLIETEGTPVTVPDGAPSEAAPAEAAPGTRPAGSATPSTQPVEAAPPPASPLFAPDPSPSP